MIKRRDYLEQVNADFDLFQRINAGDSNAYTRLYEKYSDTIFRYVFYKVGNVHDAEDMVQEVFLSVFEAFETFEWQEKPISHWLLVIAKNKVIDHWRAKKYTDSVEVMEAFGDLVSSSSPGVDEIVLQGSESDYVRKALGELYDDQRDVLILRFIEGFSHADTARVLGKTEVAVRQIQVRALRALRKVMSSPNEGSKGKNSPVHRLRALANR